MGMFCVCGLYALSHQTIAKEQRETIESIGFSWAIFFVFYDIDMQVKTHMHKQTANLDITEKLFNVNDLNQIIVVVVVVLQL